MRAQLWRFNLHLNHTKTPQDKEIGKHDEMLLAKPVQIMKRNIEKKKHIKTVKVFQSYQEI